MMRRIDHIITGLDIGGAELMLSNLVRRGIRYRHSVTSLSSNGRITGDLRSHGVDVSEMGMKKSWTSVRSVLGLAQKLRECPPLCVQTWLYHADLVGGLAARRAGIPVVWNLRQTNVGRGAHKISTALVVRLCAVLSRTVPLWIVCGSNSAREAHRAMGFDESRMLVISNGVDTNVFRRDDAVRSNFRAELGVTDDTLLVGRVGRFHPQKDYRTFIYMAGLIADSMPDVCFVLAGENVDWNNPELVGWINSSRFASRFHLLGARKDVARVMAGLDLLVSSSAFGEGFPNVVAEGMACEVPCVATDVGDSKEIVHEPARVVEAGDWRALAAAAMDVLKQSRGSRGRLGAANRRWIADRYSMDKMIDSYENLYDRVSTASIGSVSRAACGKRC